MSSLFYLISVFISTVHAYERFVVFQTTSKSGLNHWQSVISKVLHLAISINASLWMPPPCRFLTQLHSKFIIPCDIGWEHYFSIQSDVMRERLLQGPFDENAKCHGNIVHLSQKPVPEKVEFDNFCLKLFGSWFMNGFNTLYYTWFPSIGILNQKRAAFDDPTIHPQLGYSQEIQDFALSVINKVFNVSSPSTVINTNTYGALHIRRRDRINDIDPISHKKIRDCTTVERVVSFIEKSIALQPEWPQVWFIFPYVERDYTKQMKQLINSKYSNPNSATFMKVLNAGNVINMDFLSTFNVKRDSGDDNKSGNNSSKAASNGIIVFEEDLSFLKFEDNYYQYTVCMEILRKASKQIGSKTLCNANL